MEIVNNKPIMVFKTENKYSVCISKKAGDGYEKAYIPIQFNKDVELENKEMISLKNAYLSFYKWEYEGKKGVTFCIRCLDFEKEPNYQDLNIKCETQDQFEIKESDLPF